MKLHVYILQLLFAVFMIILFPVYVVMSGEAPKTPAAQVEIFKFKFIPQEITIKAGTTIRWTNKEKRQYHSVWFEKLGEEEPEYFFPDEFYERSFNKTGSFPYRCGPHPEMTGVVHVK